MKILMLNNEFPPLGGGTGTVNRVILERFADLPDFEIDLITSAPENKNLRENFSDRINIIKIPVNRYNIHHASNADLPGLEIDLITSASGKKKKQEKFSDRIELFKIPVNRNNIHHASNLELMVYAWRAFTQGFRLHHQKNYDLCFAWSAVPAGVSALGLRISSGLQYIVRVSGPDIPGFEQRYSSLYPLLILPIRAIWHKAETVIAKYEGEAEMIRAIDEDINITIIPNGVNPDMFHPGDPIPDSGPFKLLCVARLIKRKGQHHLIETVKRLTQQGIDITADLVGTGDAEDEYRELVNSLHLNDRIRFRGYIPREQMPAIYAQAHVFVLPSYNEGMSVATLEAMASGLPLIVTRTPGTDELVKEGVNGLSFSWGDIVNLSECIVALDKDRSLARQMGIASRNIARKYSWSSCSDNFLQSIFSHYQPYSNNSSLD